MLPQLGFAEIIVLSLLAIIVVGPKDLPKLMRKIGQFMHKIRSMGQEFKDAFDEMGAEDEIAEMRKEIAELRKMGSIEHLAGDIKSEMQDLNRDLRGAVGEGTSESNTQSSSDSGDGVDEPKRKEPSSGGA
ncbi:Tat protein translocase TatB subunit [Litorimonas taeanensis]|uniref:Tat protein translocase TatB subunit n=1 Tax=Litorimonas taeanensis TaxID=568099 RepID=A0A420WKU4_9PROT|nr:Sec-independent protein translocase protein TatB [Litorimonas taeanensis]RKQ71536.1 Tat protein translocase TatB subunit [Litorimonas taeanensis]